MRGFIFTEFIELVESRYGEDLADRLLEADGLSSGGAYTTVAVYPTSEMVTLVSRLSDSVAIPVADLLQLYGRHLFGYLARTHRSIIEGIEHPFQLFEVLERHVHAEVRKLYPDAEVPYFESESIDPTTLRLRYRSGRGLPDLAEGLIHGACDHFGYDVSVRREDKSGGNGSEIDFYITLIPRS